MTHERLIKICDKGIEISLYVLIFCLPFSKSIIEICFAVSLIFWLIKKSFLFKINIKGYFPQTPLNRYILFFVIACVVSSLFSIYPLVSFRALLSKTSEYILLYFFFVETINSKEKLKRFLFILIASFVLVGIDAIWQYFRGEDFIRGHTFYSMANKRLRACFSGSIGFAAWLSAISPVIVAHLFSYRRSVFSFLAFLVSLFFMIFLASTCSRAAWASVLLSAALFIPYITYSIRDVGIKSKSFFIVLLIFLLILAAGSFYVFTYPAKRDIFHVVKIEDVSTRNRVFLWKQAAMMIKDNPVLGWGLNTYSKIAPSYKIFEKGEYYPHNSILHMLIEVGIIGTAAFFAIMLKWLRTLIKCIKDTGSILLVGTGIGAASFLLQSFFDEHLYSIDLVILFWTMLALGITIEKLLCSEV